MNPQVRRVSLFLTQPRHLCLPRALLVPLSAPSFQQRRLTAKPRPKAASKAAAANSHKVLMKRKHDSMASPSHDMASRSFEAGTAGSAVMPSSPPPVAEEVSGTPTITLTPREQQLRDLLVDFAGWKDEQDGVEQHGRRQPLELRWAGGWVRDKLLGIPSTDIDVAINAMTGEEFATALQRFCLAPRKGRASEATRRGHSVADLGMPYKVDSNPEKSKALATAGWKLFGLALDFVNLRREGPYAPDSRIPTVEFGTPLEDAERRDATINALFYNLHTRAVEDHIGGVGDMRRKLIRTPLPPLKTFTDDPLRVLRLVRFASRLCFDIDRETEKAMGDETVLDALKVKISRERVGLELEKMFKGENPHKSLKLIDRLGLYHATFTDPNNRAMPRPDLTHWKAAYTFLDRLSRENSQTPGSIYDVLVTSEREDASEASSQDLTSDGAADGQADPKTVFSTWVLAAIVPWEQVSDSNSNPKSDRDTRGGSKPGNKGASSRKTPPPLPTLACTEGFRASNKLKALVTAAHQNRAAIVALRDVVLTRREPEMAERNRFGMAIREWDSQAPWRLQVLYAVLTDAMLRAEAAAAKAGGGSIGTGDDDDGDGGDGVLENSAHPAEGETWKAAAEKQAQMHREVQDQAWADWQRFLDHLGPGGLDVMGATSLKPLMDGRALSEALGAARTGPWMAPALRLVMVWQLQHPGVTDPTGAVEEVRRQAKELKIPGLS